MRKERKACRVVWFDEKDNHIPVKEIKEILTPQSFNKVRALACKRGRMEFSMSKFGNVVAKSMTKDSFKPPDSSVGPQKLC